MSTRTIPIYGHTVDNGYITVYQDQEILDDPGNEYADEGQVIDLLKSWKGQISLDVRLDESTPFLTEEDYIALGITANGPFDISKFYPGFTGGAYAINITKSYPVIIEFVGSGHLKRNGRDVI